MQHAQIILTLLSSDPDEDWLKAERRGITTYFHRGDTDLRIEYGIGDDDVHVRGFVEPWANGFSDPNADSYYVYLYYGATLIQDFVSVTVDGGRARMPLPDAGTLDVDQVRYRVAQILDDLGTLDRYVKLAGLKVLP
jgi:hypothetical protein